MKYNVEEKKAAKNFIECKIPECVKNNEFTLTYDTMEFYEALFDFAYCILNESELTSEFSYSLKSPDFNVLLKKIKNNFGEKEFYDKANDLFLVIKNIVNKSNKSLS